MLVLDDPYDRSLYYEEFGIAPIRNIGTRTAYDLITILSKLGGLISALKSFLHVIMKPYVQTIFDFRAIKDHFGNLENQTIRKCPKGH